MWNILIMLFAAGIAMPALAQEQSASDVLPVDVDAANEIQTTDGVAGSDARGDEDADLDEQTYQADEDDFVPTEEIPADEPIPFPSNI